MIENNQVQMENITENKIKVYNISTSASLNLISDNECDILLDTGASIHIICNNKYLSKFKTASNSEMNFLEMADGSKSNKIIKGYGTAKIPLTDIHGSNQYVIFKNCLFVPSFRKNIISVSLAIANDYKLEINDVGRETLRSPDGHLFKIHTRGHLYFLNNFIVQQIISRSLEEWHRYLGHPNHTDILKLPEVSENMKIINTKNQTDCEICIKAKMIKNISKAPDTRGSQPFQKIHIDLNGPITKDNLINGRFIFGAVCDFSNFLSVYVMQNKSESANVLKFYLSQISNYPKTSVIRTDWGGEFVSKEFQGILLNQNIKHEFSAPYSPHQMGHIERQWRILFNTTRAILIDTNVPNCLWPHVVKYAAFLRNRTYQKRIECTPLQKATNKIPDMTKIFLFGSKCYVYDQFNTKLEPRALEGIFIGYDETSPSILVFDPVTHNIKKSLHVKVLNTLYYIINPNVDRDYIPLRNTQEIDDNINTDNETEASVPNIGNDNLDKQPTHYNLRDRTNINYEENLCTVADNITSEAHNDPPLLPFNSYEIHKDQSLDDYFLGDKHYLAYSKLNHTNILVPNTYKQAMQSKDKLDWIEAMNKEIQSLRDNNTWDLIKPPANQEVIGGRWVFSVKVDPSHNIKFKARYVAQGYNQRQGLNFDETYAPTPTMSSIRCLMDIANDESLLCHHCDVNNAYLNANIDFEEIYVRQPQGYIEDPTLCCKLKKALYGLKQAAYRWHVTIVEFLVSQGLKQSVVDPCVFIRRSKSSTLIILIWVDDLIVAASSEIVMNTFKRNFAGTYKIKDLGELSYFLGIQFKITKNVISLNQSFYIQTILNRFNMNEAQPRSLPCDPSIYDLLRLPSELMENPTPYREMIGSLIYLMHCTRPDLAFTVTLLSRFMQKPTKMHFKLGRTVLQYLIGTKHYDLKYVKSREPLKITGYSDSDWASDNDFQSISGFAFRLNEHSALVSWRSGKQSIVAASSCEAEYIALFHAGTEAIFLRQLLAEFQQLPAQTVLIYGDNIGSITLAKHPAYHRKTRHINIKYHFIRRYVSNKSIALAYIPSRLNLADMATKPIKGPNIRNFANIRGNIKRVSTKGEQH